MIVVIAKHGYVDKQYCYFVIVSLELRRRTGSGLCLKVRINWRSQQARLVEHEESQELYILLGSHNCARVTYFTSAFGGQDYLLGGALFTKSS